MGRTTFSFIWLLLILICVGCDSANGPDLEPLIDREFEQSISFPSSLDSVFIAIGTIGRGSANPVDVFFSAEPSVSDSIRLSFLVVGETLNAEEPAVIESRSSGDTLFVWCANRAGEYRVGLNDFAKTSPIPPWLVPKRVDIAVPVGVQPSFIGRWYE